MLHCLIDSNDTSLKVKFFNNYFYQYFYRGNSHYFMNRANFQTLNVHTPGCTVRVRVRNTLCRLSE